MRLRKLVISPIARVVQNDAIQGPEFDEEWLPQTETLVVYDLTSYFVQQEQGIPCL